MNAGLVFTMSLQVYCLISDLFSFFLFHFWRGTTTICIFAVSDFFVVVRSLWHYFIMRWRQGQFSFCESPEILQSRLTQSARRRSSDAAHTQFILIIFIYFVSFCAEIRYLFRLNGFSVYILGIVFIWVCSVCSAGAFQSRYGCAAFSHLVLFMYIHFWTSGCLSALYNIWTVQCWVMLLDDCQERTVHGAHSENNVERVYCVPLL